MNERGHVEVPENAVRSESLAFGLGAPQLGILGAGVALGALLNLMPLWAPLKVVLILVGVAPVVLAAILPIRGEPAYRWLIWAVRFGRGRRSWRAVLEAPDKSQLSVLGHPRPRAPRIPRMRIGIPASYPGCWGR